MTTRQNVCTTPNHRVNYIQTLCVKQKKNELKIELITTKNMNSKKTLQVLLVILINLLNEGRHRYYYDVTKSNTHALPTFFSLVIYKKC